MMTLKIPKKLKADSIIEALCEVRFSCRELSEIIVGRLGDCQQWQSYELERLPFADIPEAIRALDPNLKFQPTLELRNPDGLRRVRIGGSVVSFHLSGAGSYCGWKEFEPQLEGLFHCLFEKLTEVSVVRIGFRYVNALTAEKHLIPSLNNLSIGITAGGAAIDGHVNLNYRIQSDDSHETMIRIASPIFVQGGLPSETTAVIDIDVATPDGLVMTSAEEVSTWTRTAHDLEKQAFFSLIPQDILNQIVEEW